MNIEATKVVSFYSGLRFKGSTRFLPQTSGRRSFKEKTRSRAGNSLGSAKVKDNTTMEGNHETI
ncbi:MAG: hypothetical protein DMF30_04770 [Verrucomicrobia bacterium]|nr:MAG: hypothetical protein DMF30_04770 [Verrucomicrobiota bacterium]